MMPKFILNDQSKVNSYGFKIVTAGINIERFKDNPVMLDGHYSGNLSVIGKWVNLKKEKGQFIADAEFDSEDTNAKAIADKVERGFLKGCSMGISFKKADLKQTKDGLIMNSCELMEASIVAIPSNPGALRLYMDGKPMEDTEIKALCLSVSNQKTNPKPNNKNNKNTMITLNQLAVIALGLDGTVLEMEPEALNTAILVLSKERDQLKAKNENFEKEKKEAQLQIVNELVSAALKEGRITADKKETFTKLATQDFELAKSTLDAIKPKTKLAPGTTPSAIDENLTMEEFQKLSLTEQLSFKENNPEGYKNLFVR